MAGTVFLWGENGSYQNYSAALLTCGCEVRLSRDVSQSETCDGLLLPGGGDIFRYLDETEYLLIQSFVTTRRPIWGICRGMQALNVWFGGTLYDHICGHQLPQGDLVHSTHAAGMMAKLLGKTPTVNSNHHQAIAQLGNGLAAMQWSFDGVVEAICHDTLPIWGVQWHPERQSFALQRSDAADAAPLFHYFRTQMR